MSTLGAILDANVLIPAPLRDVLLRAAEADLYRPYWSAAILEEVRRNVVEHGMSDMVRARRLIDRIRVAFPEAEVHGYESLIASMPNDPKDRHVLAAAVVARAPVIVTANLRHFPEEALAIWGIAPRTPDQFLGELFEQDRARMIQIIHDQVAPLQHPPLTVEQLLRNVGREAPGFVRAVREHMST
ncbi:MAG: PIN domain-containing protein [Candidatus Dormibacteraceae bacterium]